MNKQQRNNQALTSRRAFLQAAGSTAVTAGLGGISAAAPQAEKPAGGLKICIFSKHLQWLDWEGMAQTAAEIGFDGIDLTVRKGGHVLPERVETDLPKAAEIIRKVGLEIPMVTAGIVDVSSPYTESMLKTIGGLGIPRYRWGGFRWMEPTPIAERLAQLKQDAAALGELNRKYKVCAIYHTHSGMEVGASIWDLWVILKDLDKNWLGVNYDVGHATIEGGVGGAINSFRIIAPWMKGIAIKDFYWSKNAKGEWRPQWCPLGEGMVNFKRFFTMMRESKFVGPVQMHFEYPLGGADKGDNKLTVEKSTVISAMRKDLALVKNWIREAQLA
jgi:sugar phosphate isomerase/epimerase